MIVNELDAIFNDFRRTLEALRANANGPLQIWREAFENADQPPTQAAPSCLFSSDGCCVQLIYDNGFDPVNTFIGRMRLPQPVFFLIRNPVNGKILIDAPAFVPSPASP